jgi:hypothetical protein
MIARGIRLTGLRRELLQALPAGQGVASDELKRRVATGRGLVPGAPGWDTFNVSFARALRLLEGKGALEVAREAVFFGQACATWVRLTPAGERERDRVIARDERGLGGLAPEPGPLDTWRHALESASDGELARLQDLVEQERARRLLAPGA